MTASTRVAPRFRTARPARAPAALLRRRLRAVGPTWLRALLASYLVASLAFWGLALALDHHGAERHPMHRHLTRGAALAHTHLHAFEVPHSHLADGPHRHTHLGEALTGNSLTIMSAPPESDSIAYVEPAEPAAPTVVSDSGTGVPPSTPVAPTVTIAWAGGISSDRRLPQAWMPPLFHPPSGPEHSSSAGPPVRTRSHRART